MILNTKFNGENYTKNENNILVSNVQNKFILVAREVVCHNSVTILSVATILGMISSDNPYLSVPE